MALFGYFGEPNRPNRNFRVIRVRFLQFFQKLRFSKFRIRNYRNPNRPNRTTRIDRTPRPILADPALLIDTLPLAHGISRFLGPRRRGRCRLRPSRRATVHPRPCRYYCSATPHCSAKRQARDADAERDYLGKTGAWDGERDTDGKG